MSLSKGKQFEVKFKEDFKRSIPNSTIDRLYDQISGRKSIRNICDFIGYAYPNIYYLECKSHLGNTFPLSNLSQYEKLATKVGIKGVRVGVVIWFIEHKKVIYVPISTVTKMLEYGEKSINITKIEKQGYRYIEIPSSEKRVFLDSNYNILPALLGEGD